MPQPQMNLACLYLKGASLEHPAAPQAFFDDSEEPMTDKLDIQLKTTPIGEDTFEVCVRATLTLSRDNAVLLVLEVEQGGVFQLTNVPEDAVDGLLAVNAAAAVYNYLRVHVADLLTRATLPALYLPDINWVEQFQNRLAQKSADVAPVH